MDNPLSLLKPLKPLLTIGDKVQGTYSGAGTVMSSLGAADTAASQAVNTLGGVTSAGSILDDGRGLATKFAPKIITAAEQFAPKIATGLGSVFGAASKYAPAASVASIGMEGLNYFKNPMETNREVANELEAKGTLGRIGYGLLNPGKTILAGAGQIGELGKATGELIGANVRGWQNDRQLASQNRSSPSSYSPGSYARAPM